MPAVLVKGTHRAATPSPQTLGSGLVMDFSPGTVMLSGYREPCDTALGIVCWLFTSTALRNPPVLRKQLALPGGKFQMKNPTPTRGFTITGTRPALHGKKMDPTVSEVCTQTQETGGHKAMDLTAGM